jgi:hypothetical protein
MSLSQIHLFLSVLSSEPSFLALKFYIKLKALLKYMQLLWRMTQERVEIFKKF